MHLQRSWSIINDKRILRAQNLRFLLKSSNAIASVLLAVGVCGVPVLGAEGLQDKDTVVYSLENISKGKAISGNAIAERIMLKDKIPIGTCRKAADVAGKTAKFGISAYQVISKRDLREGPARRGKKFTFEGSKVVVTVNEVPKGQVLKAADLKEKVLPPSKIDPDSIPRKDFIVGLITRQKLKKGAVIKQSLVDPTDKIKNDPSRMCAAFGPLYNVNPRFSQNGK